MGAMQEIQNCDQRLVTVLSGFGDLAKQLDFTVICELADEETISQQQYPGVYRIEIKSDNTHQSIEDWMKWFKGEWERPEYVKMFTPNTKAKRIEKHLVLKDWIPLYIGKAKSVAKRVLEHVNLPLNKPTTAMKIKERKNLANCRFRLSAIRIDVDRYDVIMPLVESALREKFNPILGRQ
jgi:hypothetical protein